MPNITKAGFALSPLTKAIAYGLHKGSLQFVASAALGLGCAAPLNAAVFTVTNNNDTGTGSLRQAIADANALPGADQIVFDNTVTGSIALTGGTLEITDSLTIAGPGANQLTIDGQGSTVLYAYQPVATPGQAISIRGLTLSNGGTGIAASLDHYYGNSELKLLVQDVVVSGNSGTGIAIGENYYSDLSLELRNSVISSNGGSGVSVSGGYYRSGARGNITITGTKVTNNAGMGIRNYGFDIEIAESEISENSSGIFSKGYWDYVIPSIDIAQSTVTGNSGLGLDLYSTQIQMNQSVVADNQGAGFEMDSFTSIYFNQSTLSGNQNGGFVGSYNWFDSALEIVQSTISGNENAAGISTENSWYPQISILNSTITANPNGGIRLKSGAGSAQLENSIVEGNGALVGGDLSGEFESSHSLIEDIGTAYVTDLGGNLFGMAAMLGPLQDNGGPTQTHELLSGSPAIDTGDSSFLPPPYFDQRGDPFARVVNGRIDMGAFEVQDDSGGLPGAGMARCLGDIDGNGVIDVAHVDPEGQTDIRSLDNRFVKAFRFQGLGDLVDVEVLPSSTTVGANELLTVGTNRTELRDPLTGALISGKDLAVPTIDAEWLQDYSGNGAPELALLNADAPTVQLSNSLTSAMLGTVDFTYYFETKDLEVIEDLNGNGVQELAMLGENLDPNKGDRVEIRDPSTGEKLKMVWLGTGWQALQQAFLPDFSGNGFAEVAVLRVDDSDQKNQVQVRDSDTSQKLNAIGLGAEYLPKQLLAVKDVNGNGADEVVVFSQRFNGGNQKARVLDPKTGKALLEIFFNKEYAGQDFSSCADINGNGSEELLMLGQRASDGRLKAFVKDSKTGELLGRIEF